VEGKDKDIVQYIIQYMTRAYFSAACASSLLETLSVTTPPIFFLIYNNIYRNFLKYYTSNFNNNKSLTFIKLDNNKCKALYKFDINNLYLSLNKSYLTKVIRNNIKLINYDKSIIIGLILSDA